MTEAEKNDWVARLRSGDYLQSKDRLRDEVGYCCLGVYCEVLGIEWVRSKSGKYWTILDPNGVGFWTSKLPESLMSEYRQTAYIEMNDTNKSFDEIADQIEIDWATGKFI